MIKEFISDRPKTVKSANQAKAIERLITKGQSWNVGDKYFVLCSIKGVEYRKIS